MCNISTIVSRRIANAGFVAALLVVLLHTGGSATENARPLFSFLSNGVAHVAVPYFFLVSGLMLARHAVSPGWWRIEMGKRMRSLVLPFVIWLLLYDVFSIGLMMAANFLNGDPLLMRAYGGWSCLRYVGLYVFEPPNLIPLWFVRNLVLLVVVSPLLFWWVRKRIGIVFVLALYAITLLLVTGYCHNVRVLSCLDAVKFFFSMTGLTYFLLGAWIAFNVRTIPDHLPRFVAYGVLVVGLTLIWLSDKTAMHDVVVKLAVPFLLVGGGYIVPMGFTWKVASAAFGVYLVHPFFGMIASVAGLGNQSDWVIVSVRTLLIMVVSLSFVLFLKRWKPRFAAVVFGGR